LYAIALQRRTSTEGNSIHLGEADASYFGMTSFGYFMKPTFYSQLIFIRQLVMLTEEASIIHWSVWTLVRSNCTSNTLMSNIQTI
jgi:hypothetical protein